MKIAEEVLEAHAACKEHVNFTASELYPQISIDGLSDLAEELTDVITVCVSFLHALGFDQKARAELQRKVNNKNLMRGYMK